MQQKGLAFPEAIPLSNDIPTSCMNLFGRCTVMQSKTMLSSNKGIILHGHQNTMQYWNFHAIHNNGIVMQHNMKLSPMKMNIHEQRLIVRGCGGKLFFISTQLCYNTGNNDKLYSAFRPTELKDRAPWLAWLAWLGNAPALDQVLQLSLVKSCFYGFQAASILISLLQQLLYIHQRKHVLKVRNPFKKYS